MKKNYLLFVSYAVSILLVTSSCKKNLPAEWKGESQWQNNEVTNNPKQPPLLCDVQSFQRQSEHQIIFKVYV